MKNASKHTRQNSTREPWRRYSLLSIQGFKTEKSYISLYSNHAKITIKKITNIIADVLIYLLSLPCSCGVLAYKLYRWTKNSTRDLCLKCRTICSWDRLVIYLKERSRKLTIVTRVSAIDEVTLVWIRWLVLSPAIRWSKKVIMAACTSFSCMAVILILIVDRSSSSSDFCKYALLLV